MLGRIPNRLLRSRATVYRKTSRVLDPATAAASHSPSRQPVDAACLRVMVSGGTTGSGTVTVAGTVDGSSDTEVFTFTGNGVKLGAKRFSAIDTPDGITTTGLADEATPPTLEIRAVGVANDPLQQEYSVATSLPCHLHHSRGPRPIETAGSMGYSAPVMMFNRGSYVPREGDVFVLASGERWTITNVHSPVEGASHHEVDVKRHSMR